MTNKKHYLLNLFTNYGNILFTSLISLISVPVALNYWGTELYGVWTIITSFAVYLSVSGLGIDAATGLLMTKNRNEYVRRHILRNGLKTILLSVIICSFFLIVLYTVKPDWLTIIGKMNETNFPTAKLTATIFIISFLINMPFNVVSNAFAAYERAFVINALNTLSCVLTFAVLLVIVYGKLSLPLYAVLYAGQSFLLNVCKVCVFISIVKRHSGEKNTEADNNPDTRYSTLIKMGLQLSFYGFAVLASSNFSNLIISNNLDVSQIVPYSIAYKLFYYSFLLITSLNLSSAPLLGKEYANKNWNWIVNTYKRLFAFTLLLSCIIVIGMILFIKDIVTLWVGIEKYPGLKIIVVLGIYFIFYALSNLNFVIINSFNYTRLIGVITWAESLLFIFSAIFLVQRIGVIGICIGLLVGNLGISAWALPHVVRRNSGKRLTYDFRLLIKSIILLSIGIICAIYINICIDSYILRLMASIIFFIFYIFLAYIFLPYEQKKSIISIFKLVRKK